MTVKKCPRPERKDLGRFRSEWSKNDRKPIRQILQIESDGFYLFFSAAVQDELV